MRATAQKHAAPISGSFSFPGDKSLSHRAIIFGAISHGVSEFTNVLTGEDCQRTRKAFEQLGVQVESKDPSHIQIHGRGMEGLRQTSEPLYLGNSGTSMRLLMGLLSGCPFKNMLSGDASLSKRPMRRVGDHLVKMGAVIEGADGGNFAPITLMGHKPLKAIDAVLPMASAQVKSAILLAGLSAQGLVRVTEPELSRDHTERFLKYFGADIRVSGLSVEMQGSQSLQAKSFEIAGDISSAAFFMVLAALSSVDGIHFKNVLWNPTRTGIVNVLKRCGCVFEDVLITHKGPEPTADFTLKKCDLKAFEIHESELPSLIDEIPILCVLATQARGTSVVHNAKELRVKESDRINSVYSMLKSMGADIRIEGDTIIICGPTPLRAAVIESHKDHRIAMSALIAGQIAQGIISVEGAEFIDTSFPSFFELLSQAGGKVTRQS